MNPYQPGEDNQDPYMVGYKAGAASRDAEIAELVAALEAICDPISHMKANLPEGANLNGAMAVQISNDTYYLKGIAKAALAATEPKE